MLSMIGPVRIIGTYEQFDLFLKETFSGQHHEYN